MNKNIARLRRAKSTRSHIRELAVPRLSRASHRQHIYAQVTSANGDKVIASASTVQKAIAGELKGTKNKSAAAAVGKAVAERALKARRREGRVRPLGFPLSRSHPGAGRCGARGGLQVLRAAIRSRSALRRSDAESRPLDHHNSKRPSRKQKSALSERRQTR